MSRQRATSPRPVSTVSTQAGPSDHSDAPSIAGTAYLEALAQFIRRHEAALADYNAPRPRISPAPSWTTVLTLGIVPTADPSPSDGSRSMPAPPRKDPLVLRFDPHHLYYLLLKFDEIDLPSSGDLDVRVEGGTTRPMMVDYSAMSGPSATTTTPGLSGPNSQGKDGDGASLFGGMFGRPRADDTRSIQSGMSSFSFGSGWWGLGSKQPQQVDEAATVRYIYSSCTKLPALRLSPFQLSPPSQSGSSSSRNSSGLSRIVQGFEDCPPPATCVPLLAFKNLSSLTLEDLDPRGFLGWDVLSVQLRSLSVHRGGIEDLGELICDAPSEDLARREQEERRNKPVGTERKRRAEGVMQSSLVLDPREETGVDDDEGRPPSSAASVAAYPTPPRLAWSSLRHLSLADNSLTFIPSPPLTFLPTLTSLDLSSNLLITIPPGLAHLTSLRSLNLSDNMIDSLLGIAKALGAIEVLNLSQNRLENLSGLDRLPALERLDLRSNAVYDVLEVSRLARLPHLRELWLAENPLTASRLEGGDDKWRVKCFGYFAEEEALGHRDLDAGQVRIDGRIMTSSERRVLEAEYLSRQGRPLGLGRRKTSHDVLRGGDRPAEERNGQQAKVVGRRVVTAPHRHARAPSPPPPPVPSASPQPDTADTASVNTASADERSRKAAIKPKRRKPQRIVDLDGPDPRSQSSRGLADDGTTDSDQAGARLPPATSDARPGTSGPKQRPSGPGPRRERMPSTLGDAAATAADSSSSEAGSGEAFRRKIEALRNEVGESWLSVLAEREAREERERKERERVPAAPQAAPVTLATAVPSAEADPQPSPSKAAPSRALDPILLEPPETDREPPVPTADQDDKPGESPIISSGPAQRSADPVPRSTPLAMPADDVEREAAVVEEEEEPVAAGSTAVPTAVKSVRKKRGKGKKKGGR
ncbi:hypothetical protein BMF94_5880 [Rhodotorula taiwanensis]|uniref:Uncharacterized protein n=1 Tax=Rhodotorula taiwanensis TaxID=741276 RepID=A0A2S5B2V7_9BASI|nr:hypothetical protein BMF94_5880 [Rhodotorula taiwanensis]